MADTDLGRRLSGLIGEESGGGGGPLLGSLIGALGSGGGQSVTGLVQQLREGGLGDAVGSWVGTGPNRTVSGPDVAQALPYQTLDHAAHESGLTPEQAADRIAGVLPQAVDRLTPDGTIPAGTLDEVIREGR
ncbi:YidB family protein [Streptomyces sp. SL13]|uniref:YidB family protein n=1 Tax=Streptantibioticus silvisoli TaxID=2705255 RepID=A0AA90HAD6_9ACTN|nr:YidB family protein [Streptantibioticus silvisoli]MDI5967186.1 YidB family protein [Streptantibioticus silvisoli]MDI5974236.1 YidB family protein [Streptantibioticus silvisoli]